jgi:3-oxoacyl-ACP reductase-like protein
MSIFESIKNAIFGHSAAASTPGTGSSSAAPAATAPAQRAAPAATTAAQPSASPPAQQPVDVEAVLNGLAAKNPQKLNWQNSIVDLMKLLGLDSSLQNRTALAKELGYTGNTSDSAAMNIWLHQQVMRKLAESGGKVPQSLRG